MSVIISLNIVLSLKSMWSSEKVSNKARNGSLLKAEQKL